MLPSLPFGDSLPDEPVMRDITCDMSDVAVARMVHYIVTVIGYRRHAAEWAAQQVLGGKDAGVLRSTAGFNRGFHFMGEASLSASCLKSAL